ncbi:tyrosine-type recombinase/integrase [Ferruginibacter sp. SUN106]|uniref:tyrosine-type recombinase/integrase n=1 Tax=Ferruginibacter sp. SUN106 TaxID=2978348 RepID=UPI003D3635E2
MPVLTLKAIVHRRQECIAIYFANDKALQAAIRKLPAVKWSQANTCWYVPLSEGNYEAIVQTAVNKATVDNTHLKAYLQKRKGIAATLTPSQLPSVPAKIVLPLSPAYRLCTENIQALEQLIQQLQLKAYSASTMRTYRNEFLQLLQLLQTKPVNNLTAADIKRYMVYAMEKEGISENTAHSRLNALKFYFEQVLGREKFFWDIPRPKKPQLLPKLLNEEEIRQLFNALANKKHKAMLFTVYSAGLRVSEIAALKIADIDSKRMQLFISRAKGKKDRYVNLSPVLLDILRNYFTTYKPAPVRYLFESEQTGQAYPTRTIQQIFTNAKNKAGIKKEVGIHSLRHSFATHLLDKGTDIKYIKELLGHFDIKTTERYLHVSKKQLVNIVSPFDDLWKQEAIDW